MLKLQIIRCLDVKDGRLVQGINFVSLLDAGDPIEQATVYDGNCAGLPVRLPRLLARVA